jgi:hypothetical protein
MGVGEAFVAGFGVLTMWVAAVTATRYIEF